MKKIKYLREEENKKFYAIFSRFIKDPKKLENSESVDFNKICISIFDHWLSEEEASQQINSFPVFIQKIARIDFNTENILGLCKEYYQNEAKFISWYTILYKNLNIICYDKTKNSFYNFNSFEDYIDSCQRSIREQKFLNLFLPDYECIIEGNFDFTCPVSFKDQNRLYKILDYAKAAGLYPLE